jgi:hypothetical protein
MTTPLMAVEAVVRPVSSFILHGAYLDIGMPGWFWSPHDCWASQGKTLC